MPASRTSLLGLPPELRLHIYDMVASSKISGPAFYSEYTQYTAGRRDKRLGRAVNFQLPVTNLAMSCSFIADEIRKHIHALPTNHRFAELPTTTSVHFTYGKLFLQRAPCHIGDLTVLKVVIDLEIDKTDYCDLNMGFKNPSWSQYVKSSPHSLACTLLNLVHPGDFIGRNARTLAEVHLEVNVTRGTRNNQSKEDYNKLVQEVRDAYERVFVADLFSREGRDSAPILRLQEITSENWVDRSVQLEG